MWRHRAWGAGKASPCASRPRSGRGPAAAAAAIFPFDEASDAVRVQTRSGISTYWTSASPGSSTRAGSFGPPKRNSASSPLIWSVTSSR